MRGSLRWRAAVLDGVAVLLGILIAFGIDAWWQERSDRATEHELLTALRDELTDARRGLVEHGAALDRDTRAAAELLMTLSSADAATLGDDSLVVLSRRMIPPDLYHPPRAALDDLTSSGGIALVQSDSLRRSIAAYEQALSQDLRIQELLLDIWLTHLAPYLYDHSTVVPSGEVLGLTEEAGVHVRRTSIDREAYVDNRTFQNLVSARALRVDDVRGSHRNVLEALERLMESLERAAAAS